MLKKRIMSLLLVIAMVTSLFPGIHAAAEDTVQIGNWEQFIAFLSEGAGRYELTADITAPADMEPIGGFGLSGAELEGNGYTVSGLKLEGALFTSLVRSAVRHVVFSDIKVRPATGSNEMAVLALSMDLDSFVTGCVFRDVRMELAGTTSRAAVVTVRNHGTITNCTVERSVTLTSADPVQAGLVGGIAALNDSDYGYIINCISRAAIGLASGSGATVGGIVGANHAVVQYCFVDMTGQEDVFSPVVGSTSGSSQKMDRCVYLAGGSYTMLGGRPGKDYASMDVYHLAAEMTELVMNEYDQELDLSWFSEQELACPWSVENGGLALSLDWMTAQVYVYVDKELENATVTITDPYARKVDDSSYTGRKYSVRVGQGSGQSYERNSLTVSLELPYETMAKNFILRPNPGFVKKLENVMDGDGSNYTDMYLVPSRTDGGVTQTYTATKGLYPFAMTLSLTQMKPGDGLVPYCFAGTGTAADPYQIATIWELSLLGEYVAQGTGANGIEFSRAHYILTKDLDLRGWTQTTMEPIGDLDAPFRGVFDGQGHTIRGFTVNNTRSYMGLFGVVMGDAQNRAQIRDLVVRDVTITGPDNALHGDLRGGVVGRASYADLIGLVTTGSVSGGTQIGGIAGYTYHCDILGCGSVVELTSYSSRAWVGGIVGNAAYGTVENCYADVDYVHNDVIRREYLQVGTIVGELKDAKLVHCWYDGVENTALFDISYTTASDKTTMTSAAFAQSLADYASRMELGVTWQSRAGQAEMPYPVPMPDSLAEHAVRCARSSQGALTADRTMAVSGTTVTVRPAQIREGATLTGIVVLDRTYQPLQIPVTIHDDGSYSFVMPSASVYVAPLFDTAVLYGMGTEEAPYLIRSFADLELMGELVASGTDTLEGCTAYEAACYRMTTDIDCGGEFLPNIGSSSRPFYGWFDGDGHAICNFYGNATGFFVRLRQSVVSHGISVSDLVMRDGEGGSTAILSRWIDTGVKIRDVEFRDIVFHGTGSVLALETAGNIDITNCVFRDLSFNAGLSSNALLTQIGISPSLVNVMIHNVTGCTRLNNSSSTGGLSNVVCSASDITGIDGLAMSGWGTIATLSGYAQTQLEEASLWADDPNGGARLVFGGAGAVSFISYASDFYEVRSPIDPATAPTTGKGGTHIQIPYDPTISLTDLVIEGPQGKITPVLTNTADGTPVLDFLMPEGKVEISNGGRAFRYRGLLGGGTEGNPYLIETAEELKFFADVCNGQIPLELLNYNVSYPEASVRLLGDISMEGIAWEGIGDDGDSVPFTGRFDGDGHTISKLGHSDGADTGIRQPLFIQVGPAGVVEDLIVTDASIRTDPTPEVGTGVIAKNNKGTIRRCLVTGSTIENDGDTYCGGIVGVNWGYLEDCGIAECVLIRQEGSITTGAVVHTNFGTVSDCFAYDVTIQGGDKYSGAILINNEGTVDRCYHDRVDTLETLTGTVAATREEFHDGTVAFALNGGITDGSQPFYQVIDSAEPADLWPVPVEKDGGTVYANVCVGEPYTNFDPEDHFRDAVNGFCPRCGDYQPAVLIDDGDVYEYQIYNAGQLFWLAREQNERQSRVAMHARLMADIDANPGYTFHADGTVTYEGTVVTGGWRHWVPIGKMIRTNGEDHQYHGHFDGDGHTVSGLYVDDTSLDCVGLIGYMHQGRVHNVAVVNSYFRAAAEVGGILGSGEGTIRNCFSSATVVSCPAESYQAGTAGGLAGSVSGYSEVTYDLAVGLVDGGHKVVGSIYGALSVRDNYYLNGVPTDDGGRTAEQLASGEVAFLLQDTPLALKWGQKIGTDPYPVLGGPRVYAERWCTGEVIRYGNEEVDPVHVGLGEDGLCIGCGETGPAMLVDGYYEIWNLGHLIWFGQKILEDAHVKGRLMADLTVVSDHWTPLGSGTEFQGTFDGQWHTITMELDFGPEPCDRTVGLFSNTTSGAVFRDLVLEGSVVCNSDERVGALVGSAYNTTIENVLSYVDVTNTCTGINGSNSHPGTGGITGIFGGGSHAVMRNCAVYADVTAGYACVGGLVGKGWPGKQYYTIGNCAFVGDVTATADIPAGSVVGYHDTDSNLTTFGKIWFHEKDGLGAFGKLDGTENSTYQIDQVEEKSMDAFHGGEVACLLAPGFGQTLGIQTLPVPGGEPVYHGYVSCDEDQDMVYTNDSSASDVRPAHQAVSTGYDTDHHWGVCVCGKRLDIQRHTTRQSYDETGHWTECDCGYISGAADHDLWLEYDESGHWEYCFCGYESGHQSHTMQATYDEWGHRFQCWCGFFTGYEDHSLTQSFDDTGHWQSCDCGYASQVQSHGAGWMVDGQYHQRFCDCGWTSDISEHQFYAMFDGETHWYICYVCDWHNDPEPHDHSIVNADEKDHWYACRCGHSLEKAPHEGGTAWCNERKVCTVCGEHYGEPDPLNHASDEYVNGFRVCCGEPLPVEPGLNLGFPSLSFEDEVHYNVYFTVDDPDHIVSMGLAIFDTRLEDGTVEDAVELVEGYQTNGVHYMVRSNGIPAKNMGDTVYFRVYARLEDGSCIYSDMGGYNARAYAQQILGDEQATQEMKSLVVALIRYGAEAQKYFGHRTDDLMDGFLADTQKAMVMDYDPALVADLVKPPVEMTERFPKTEGGFKGGIASYSFEGALALNIYMGTAQPVDGEVRLYYWDMKTFGTIDAFTVENATGTLTMVSTGVEDHHWAAVEGIPAKKIDETIFFATVYESGGEPVISGVSVYSVGEYCKQIAAREGSAQQDFAKATAVYGCYAKAYFMSIGQMQ